jgi:hypothetical protein
MLALSRHTAIGLASIAIIVSCGHSDHEYLEMDLKLMKAANRRDDAMTAAARDRGNYSAIAMLNAVNEFRDKSRSERPSPEAMAKLSPKVVYEMNLQRYNEINKILRAYGFGDIAIDFDPSK